MWYIAGGVLLTLALVLATTLLLRKKLGFDADWLYEKWWVQVIGFALLLLVVGGVRVWIAEQQSKQRAERFMERLREDEQNLRDMRHEMDQDLQQRLKEAIEMPD